MMANEIKGSSDLPYHNAETEAIQAEREAALNAPAVVEPEVEPEVTE
jgi:hypothetical protein